MFKKLVLLTVAVLSMLSLPAQAWRNDEITMLVIPREVTPLQIGQDISRRYPVLLVSYQMVQGELKIHAWNGDNWVFVPVEDYTNGTFFATRPKNAIIVENEKVRAPDVLTPSSLWCGSANRLTSTDPRVMLHLLGLSFDFPFRHWDQLANRYGYALEEINPTLENVYWWNLQGDVLMEKRARRDFSADLNNWRYLETIPAPVIEPVMIEEPAPEAATAAPGATDVDITARPASEKAEPIPAVESAPVEPAAAPMPAPIAESAPDAPVVETPAPPVAIEETVESVPAVDIAAEPEVPAVAPTETIVADPFSADEIPAAEIVVPAEPKKSWWKIF